MEEFLPYVMWCDSEPESKNTSTKSLSYPKGFYKRFKKNWASDFVGAASAWL